MKRKKMKLVLLKDLTLTVLVPFTLGLIIIFSYILVSVKQETAAMQEAVISLDYTPAEPYLEDLLEKEGKDIWSHFIITNQYELTKGGYDFMLNSDGTLSAHPDSERVLNECYGKPESNNETELAFYNSIPKDLKELYQEMMEGKSGSKMIEVDDEVSLCSYFPVDLHNMSICIVTPVSEVFSLVEGLIYQLKEQSGELKTMVGTVSDNILSANANVEMISDNLQQFAIGIEEATESAEELKENSEKNLNFAAAIADYAKEGNDYTMDMHRKDEEMAASARDGENTALGMLSQIHEELSDSSVKQDYQFFLSIADNYSADAAEISKMMNRFSEHAQQLRQSFSVMTQSIAHISSNLDDNSAGIEKVVTSTEKYVSALHEISNQVNSCDRISV